MDVEVYRNLIGTCFPEVEIRTVWLIEEGWDSVVAEVNGELIFRFPRRVEVEAGQVKEVALLPELAERLPVRVPVIEYLVHRSDGCEMPFMGYRKIAGEPLSLQSIEPGRIAGPLASFLNALHSFPVERAARVGVPLFTPESWRQVYVDFYTWARAEAWPMLDADLRSGSARAWEDYLEDEENFCFTPVLTHSDLGREHLLCDPVSGILSGVIDWEDACVGDPAIDFVGLLDKGDGTPNAAFVEQVLRDYRGETGRSFWNRMEFLLFATSFHVLRYGFQTSDTIYLRQGLQRLRNYLTWMDQ